MQATDESCAQRYSPRMADRKKYQSPPKFPMNQWAREAFSFAADQGKPLTYDEVAEAMTKAGLGLTYHKTMVQKMTTIRKVSLAEAEVLSRVTGYPIPDGQREAAGLEARYSKLSEKRQRALTQVLQDLEAAEELDRQAKSSRDALPG